MSLMSQARAILQRGAKKLHDKTFKLEQGKELSDLNEGIFSFKDAEDIKVADNSCAVHPASKALSESAGLEFEPGRWAIYTAPIGEVSAQTHRFVVLGTAYLVKSSTPYGSSHVYICEVMSREV